VPCAHCAWLTNRISWGPLESRRQSADSIVVSDQRIAAQHSHQSTGQPNDPSHDLLRSRSAPLDSIFHPRNVAVIGATDREGSVGRSVLANLRSAPFRGQVFAVNPKRDELLGQPAFRSIGKVPAIIDLAIVVTPAVTVPGVVRECVQAGAKSVVTISAGFRERGAEGAELERQVAKELAGTSVRLIGPNCLGVMNPLIGLNATFAQTIARPGNVAFLSQSGALLTAILDWSLREKVGFSSFVSTGSMLDVSWGDLITYFGDDPYTKSIVIYMESVGDARSFLSAAREVTLSKPVIVLKAGRSEAASKAAASHTGALTGSDAVLDAAFRRCGVLRVNSISDLFYMADVLGKQPRPRGPRLTILTNAGGPAVLATDALIAEACELAPLSTEQHQSLDVFLPNHWSHGNPIDILGDADPERYSRAVSIAAANPESDGMLVILAPQGMTDPTEVARRLEPHAHSHQKPILASWMGGDHVSEGDSILGAADIPTFSFPDTAARMFAYMWRHAYNLRGIYETPTLTGELPSSSREQAALLLEEIRAKGRTLLTEYEAKKILSLYGIPTVETRLARTPEEAAVFSIEIGFPVVLKLHSETITHKTDVGGVQLDLADAAAVETAFKEISDSVAAQAGPEHFLGVTVQPMVRRRGYELLVGSTTDPQFGPVLVFGTGGQLVEVYRDRALALPPLNTTLAQRMMEQTRIYTALKGVRGRASLKMDELEGILVRFSYLVAQQKWIKEIDVNPLLGSPEGFLALDARIILHDLGTDAASLANLAIRPFPTQYQSASKMKDGTEVMIRPIRPEDEPLMVKFHHQLSDRSVYLRYFQMSAVDQRVAHERLLRICFIDYDREIALVVQRGTGDSAEILAVGRLIKAHAKYEAEAAILVRDQFQRRGLGTELLKRLIHIARQEGVRRIVLHMLRENFEMQAMATKLGFHLEDSPDRTLMRGIQDL
jgi:acetyltransferase